MALRETGVKQQNILLILTNAEQSIIRIKSFLVGLSFPFKKKTHKSVHTNARKKCRHLVFANVHHARFETSVGTHMCVFVQHVVGEFKFFKGNCLLGELFPRERRVRVDVQSGGEWGIRLSCDEPRGPVVGVAVALVIHGHDVHENSVAGVGVETVETDPDGREHSSTKGKKRGSEKFSVLKCPRQNCRYITNCCTVSEREILWTFWHRMRRGESTVVYVEARYVLSESLISDLMKYLAICMTSRLNCPPKNLARVCKTQITDFQESISFLFHCNLFKL